MGSLSEEVKIGKSEVFNYKKLVTIIHDLGYNEFYMLSKACYDQMGRVKDDKQLKNVLLSNNKKLVDLYVLERDKNFWIESESEYSGRICTGC